MMHGGGKSDEAVVAMKPANEVERSVEESVERRAEAKGNASQQSTFRAQNREDASQALERIRLTAHQQLPSHTRGGSRMRESRTYGSVRGALSNERPYRDRSESAFTRVFNALWPCPPHNTRARFALPALRTCCPGFPLPRE